MIKGLGQRFVFDDGDLVLDSALANQLRQIVLPFGYDAWYRTAIHVIVEGHSEVRRIDYDCGSLGNRLHHVLPNGVALKATDAVLHLLIAFDVFHLVPDFLLRHPHLASELASLAEDVKRTKCNKHQR